jgi:hypothetical protein
MMASTKWRAARGFGRTLSEQVVEEYLIPSPSVLSRRERKDCLSVPSTTEPRVRVLVQSRPSHVKNTHNTSGVRWIVSSPAVTLRGK